MAEAIIAGLLRQGITTPEHILASGPRLERVEELNSRYEHPRHIPITAQQRPQADVVILSIKPQRLQKVLHGLEGAIPAHALVLSIIAGATIQTIADGLKHPAVVRSMPNTPAQIGEGITVWTASSAVSRTSSATRPARFSARWASRFM